MAVMEQHGKASAAKTERAAESTSDADPRRHATLWTVVETRSCELHEIRRWKDPVDAQRDADGVDRSNGASAIVLHSLRP